MIRAQLHLVASAGTSISSPIKTAVENAFRWTLRRYPMVDSALIANWAEDVALSMETAVNDLQNPSRYAMAALSGRVRDWLKTCPAQLECAGLGNELERLAGSTEALQSAVDGRVLVEQLKATLSGRDHVILVLLVDGATDGEISAALGVAAPTARKAIQRLRDRLAAKLNRPRAKNHPGHGSTALCKQEETSGVEPGSAEGLPPNGLPQSRKKRLSRRTSNQGAGRASCSAA